jgi:hypothetical protein
MPAEVGAPKPGARWSFTSHPAFQLVSLLIGILGVALAFFFYFQGKRERKPLYVLQPTRNIIVNRALAVGKRLTVLYDGQSLEAQNVTAMQCTLWNAGSEPIKASDILVPIRLSLPENTEILDISVIRQSRPSVVNFTAIPEKGPKGERTNAAVLSFSILEKGDGATLQLVYIGPPEAAATIDGTVVGAQVTAVGRPLDLGEPAGNDTGSHSRTNRALKLVMLAYLFLPFVMAIPAGKTVRRFIKGEPTGPIAEDFGFLTSRKFWFFQGVWTLLILGAYYYLFHRYPEVPTSLLASFLS